MRIENEYIIKIDTAEGVEGLHSIMQQITAGTLLYAEIATLVLEGSVPLQRVRGTVKYFTTAWPRAGATGLPNAAAYFRVACPNPRVYSTQGGPIPVHSRPLDGGANNASPEDYMYYRGYTTNWGGLVIDDAFLGLDTLLMAAAASSYGGSPVNWNCLHHFRVSLDFPSNSLVTVSTLNTDLYTLPFTPSASEQAAFEAWAIAALTAP